MVVINGEEFLTVEDMAERLKKSKNAVKKLLHNADLRPISKDALYPIKAYEVISNTRPVGRPPKAKPEPAKKPVKKGRQLI